MSIRDNYQLIRRYYEQKKIRRHRSKPDYEEMISKNPNWDDLAPPLNPSAIASWAVNLPQDFIDYLTLVSAEIFCSSYPVLFTEERPTSLSENEYELSDEEHAISRYHLTVGNGGCTFADTMDIRTGLVYAICYDDEDCYQRLRETDAVSFGEYILRPIRSSL